MNGGFVKEVGEFYFGDRIAYLTQRTIPLVEFLDSKDVDVGISVSKIEEIVEDLQSRRSIISREDAPFLYFDAENAQKHLHFEDRRAYNQLLSETESNYYRALREFMKQFPVGS